jgi:hypothetical protein
MAPRNSVRRSSLITLMAREPDILQRKDIYAQLCDEFRSLNNIFWRVPILAMSLNGGVGFALGSIRLSPQMQTALLIFMFLCNVCFIFILWRLRMQVMQEVLNRIAEMEHRHPRRPHFHIVYVFMLVLATAGSFSLVSIFYREAFFPRFETGPTYNITVRPPLQQTLPIDE